MKNHSILIPTLAAALLATAGTYSLPGQSTGTSTQSTPPASAASTDLAGKWTFVFDTEGGDRTFQADFVVNGETVTGKWDKKADVKGTYKDGKLELEFPSNSDEVGEGTLKISGVMKDGLTGNWSFQTYEGKFKATRDKS